MLCWQKNLVCFGVYNSPTAATCFVISVWLSVTLSTETNSKWNPVSLYISWFPPKFCAGSVNNKQNQNKIKLAQKLTLLDCIQKVPDSNLSLNIISLDFLRCFLQSPRKKLCYFLKLKHDRLASYSFNFAIGDHPNKQACILSDTILFLLCHKCKLLRLRTVWRGTAVAQWVLTFIVLMWRIGWAHNNARK